MITIDGVESVIQNLPQDLRDRTLQFIEELNKEYQQYEKKFSFDWVSVNLKMKNRPSLRLNYSIRSKP